MDITYVPMKPEVFHRHDCNCTYMHGNVRQSGDGVKYDLIFSRKGFVLGTPVHKWPDPFVYIS